MWWIILIIIILLIWKFFSGGSEENETPGLHETTTNTIPLTQQTPGVSENYQNYNENSNKDMRLRQKLQKKLDPRALLTEWFFLKGGLLASCVDVECPGVVKNIRLDKFLVFFKVGSVPLPPFNPPYAVLY